MPIARRLPLRLSIDYLFDDAITPTGESPAITAENVANDLLFSTAQIRPAAWWAADDLALSNGANVTSWVDRIYGLTLAGATSFPTYQTNVQNALPAVRFSRAAGNRALAVATPAQPLFDSATGGTVFIVAKAGAAPASPGYQTFYDVQTSTAVDRFSLYTEPTSNFVSQYGRRNNGDALSSVLSSTVAATSARLYRSVMNWSTGTVTTSVAGSSILTGTLTSAGTTSASGNANIFVGNDSTTTTTGCFDGDIYEIIFFEQVLSTAEIADVETYLNAKWGLGGATQTAQGDLTVTPATSGAGASTKSGDGAVTISPTVAATAITVQAAQGNVTITPTVAAAGVSTKPADTALTITPAVAAAGSELVLVQGSLSVVPSVDAVASRSQFATADLTITPAVAAAAVVVRPAAAAITVTPAVASDGSVTTGGTVKSAQADVTISPTVAAAAAALHLVGSSDVAVNPAVTAAATRTLMGAVSLTVSPTMSAAAFVVKPADVTVTVTVTTAGAGLSIKPVTGSVTVTPSTDAGGEIAPRRGVMLPVTRPTAAAAAAQRTTATSSASSRNTSRIAVVDRSEASMTPADKLTSTMTGA